MENNIKIVNVEIDNIYITIHLSDKRIVSTPLYLYPRLQNATEKQRNNYKISGSGKGIHWTEIDEDLSMEGLINAIPSPEYKIEELV
jgi:hypothetical protein